MKRRYMRVGNWAYFGVPLMLAALAAYGIAVLQHKSDDYRQVQLDLANVHGFMQQLHAFEEEGVAEKRFSSAHLSEVKKIREEAGRIFGKLTRSDSQSLLLLRASDAFQAYGNALDQEFPCLNRGDVEGAEKIADAETDPAFEILGKSIKQANVYYDDQATAIKLQADIGTTLMLLGMGLFCGVFMMKFARIQNLRARQEADQRQEAHTRALISNISDILILLDADGIVRFVNETSLSLLGFDPHFLQEKSLTEFLHPDDRSAAGELFRTARQSARSIQGELRLRDEEGVWHSFEVVANDLQSNSEISGLLVTFRDVTERKVLAERMAYQAHHDALTLLPNRACFGERLNEALEQAAQDNTGTAVVFVDLDNFKLINDTLGHEAGDQLLMEIARRLSQCVTSEDLVARLGGDEFTLLLERRNSVEEVIEVADRIVSALCTSMNLVGSEVFTSASVGIAFTYRKAMEPDLLLRNADTAMYEAKSNGKASYVLFEARMNDRVVERLAIETGLRFAVEREELRVHYQPLIDLETGLLTGMEALIRWEHPLQGLIPPGKFIPIAEETGLILPIGYWVLTEACHQAQEWRLAYPEHPPFTLNVNLSGKQLQQEDVVARVYAVLQETGLPPNCLKLEITESVMMDDVETTVARLNQLKALGIKLAMDDFGTGYSSMATLNAFPLDTIKIDRSFIQRLSGQEDAASVVQAIIQLSKALNMDVTAEGIETEDQVSRLQWLGCNTGQGFFFARPQPASVLDSQLAMDEKFYLTSSLGPVEKEQIEHLLRAA